MTTQQTLFNDFDPPAETRYERFKKFHAENPQVYQYFLEFARLAVARRVRFGARMIWERIRWYTLIETTDAKYKLNDHNTPYYARLAMLEFPEEFGGFFELRDNRFDTDEETMRRDLLCPH